MEFSLFGERFSQDSGILELMDDLGRALGGREKTIMLGGGNPASIPAVNAVWRRRLVEILSQDGEMEAMLAHYDGPGGNLAFLETLAAVLRERFGWDVGPGNIAITHGSQNGFYQLLNFFSGEFVGGRRKKVLFPLAPEYIGYADQGPSAGSFASVLPRIQEEEAPFFKYHVDFSALALGPEVAALCASRPTNPTGNVLTDEEIARLSMLARERGVPFLIDNAYGAPFPSILFRPVVPFWDENTILSMSLSKLGLPATRTGIVVACEKVIRAVGGANAILNLANGGIGQRILRPLLEDGSLFELCERVIQPFYEAKKDFAVEQVIGRFAQRFPWRLHRPEGALFLWLWFPALSIPTRELYERLKKRRVLIVPGEYFFFGLGEEAADWPHRRQCIRVNFAREEQEVVEGISAIAEEVERGCGKGDSALSPRPQSH
jgi:valine--pyruvate aminotransferase